MYSHIRKISTLAALLCAPLIAVFGMSSAQAAGGVVSGPNVVAPDRYVYYPGTEVLAEDEVRVVACGTGMPDQRRGQASVPG